MTRKREAIKTERFMTMIIIRMIGIKRIIKNDKKKRSNKN